MAETLPDVAITSTEYVSLNAATGIPIGTNLTLQLKTVTWIRLVESATQPNADVTDGVLLTNLDKPYAVGSVLTGSLEVWAICTNNRTGKLSVQEVV